MPARLLLTGIWFTSLILLFNRITSYLSRYTFGIVEYFGTHSLTAYIVHGLILCIATILFVKSNDWLLNTVLGLATVLLTCGVIRLPLIRKIIPR